MRTPLFISAPQPIPHARERRAFGVPVWVYVCVHQACMCVCVCVCGVCCLEAELRLLQLWSQCVAFALRSTPSSQTDLQGALIKDSRGTQSRSCLPREGFLGQHLSHPLPPSVLRPPCLDVPVVQRADGSPWRILLPGG